MIKILLTGFMPFGGEVINPSYEAIKKINAKHLNVELHLLELPVIYYESSHILIEKIKDLDPDVILMIGQAGGRKAISIERVAINLDDSKTPDAKGVTPMDDPISLFGPTAYFSTLPDKQIYHILSENHIPVELSYSAGIWFSLNIFYSVMHELDVSSKHHVKAGFIHVPYETSQTINKAHMFSLDLNVIRHALELIIDTVYQGLTM